MVMKDHSLSYKGAIIAEVEDLPTLDDLCFDGSVGVIDRDYLSGILQKLSENLKDYIEECKGAKFLKEIPDNHALGLIFESKNRHEIVTISIGYDQSKEDHYTGTEKPEIAVERDDKINVYPAERLLQAVDENF